jgi:Kef-type K+ transport system membrane component KefB
MVAGILLGPTLLGWLAPGISSALFPTSSLSSLNALSQIGLVLFMFLVGMELDTRVLWGRIRATVITSYTSIIIPFALGMLLAACLYQKLSPPNVPLRHFALFIGTAMSVTAFPVLARILHERKLTQTPLGAVALACAAVDDVTAWCLLAGLLLLVKTTTTHATSLHPLWLMLAGAATFIGVMIFLVRPALRRLVDFQRQCVGGVSYGLLAIILLIMFASAWTTERIGLHALFGAFIAGTMMPKERDFVRGITSKLEGIAVVLLLPIFFAFTGLRTSIGLLSEGNLWFYCALIILIAVAGKFGGSMFAARATGMEWREAGALGALMNTRGLMELVILSIGLDIGIITPTVFTMMVIMALTTTLMTTPLLDCFFSTHNRSGANELNQVGDVWHAEAGDRVPT